MVAVNPQVRSISACAEEPSRPAPCWAAAWVDLRVRGGAGVGRRAASPRSGRSPRARRSLERANGDPLGQGSISACAEEPAGFSGPAGSARVDLRVRGGAGAVGGYGFDDRGRSPRARRSHELVAPITDGNGSISACAEEPGSLVTLLARVKVDLRVRGGAQTYILRADQSPGRSPRARRSRVTSDEHRQLQGSISACAEEPARAQSPSRATRVDLRVRGGAAESRHHRGTRAGRSPRARRSQASMTEGLIGTGSISACAEEPTP